MTEMIENKARSTRFDNDENEERLRLLQHRFERAIAGWFCSMVTLLICTWMGVWEALGYTIGLLAASIALGFYVLGVKKGLDDHARR